MTRYAFMYPGQGSQTLGMGRDYSDTSELARRRFEEANDVLGRDLTKICFEGPEDQLKATQNTQPALFTVEAVITDYLSSRGIKPAVTMGHSLGEYSALYGAGAFSFADGLRLVARRGELMAEAGKKAPGTMAAVIGLARAEIEKVLQSVTCGIVVCANENTPDQTVISGEVAAVNEACTQLKAAGAKRAVPLPVSGAFHSPLMQEAANEFSCALDKITFAPPVCPVIANVTAQAESDPATLKSLLVKQLVSPVRWVESVMHLAGHGELICCEVGPGAVLQGLVRKITPDLKIVACGRAEVAAALTA